jgi:hypothetical protein
MFVHNIRGHIMKKTFLIIPFIADIGCPVYFSGSQAAENNPDIFAAAIQADSRLDIVQACVWTRLFLIRAIKKCLTATGGKALLFLGINDKTILQRKEATVEDLPKKSWRKGDPTSFNK